MRGRRRMASVSVGALALIVLISGALALSRPLPSPSPWWTDARAIHRGARDFATGSCISCHALAGVSDATAAVDLTHEGGRRSISWLLHELAHPTSQRPPIPDGQLRDLAAYLASQR